MKPHSLFARDFTLMVVGQIVSLFGNSILRFALSLHVLETTGSAAAFGGISALAMVPTLLCGPLGGVLADRVPRQAVMWGLDFATAGLTLGYALLFPGGGPLGAVGAMMVLLAAIQALYQPAVQASVPLLVPEGRLAAANGAVSQVQALANLLGPVLGGVLAGPVLSRRGAERWLLAAGTLPLLPLAAILALGLPAPAAYAAALGAVGVAAACAVLFTVAAMTALQRQVPPHLLGKTAAFVAALATCAMPLGQGLYGLLFDALPCWAVLLLGGALSLAAALAAGPVLGRLAGLDGAEKRSGGSGTRPYDGSCGGASSFDGMGPAGPAGRSGTRPYDGSCSGLDGAGADGYTKGSLETREGS